MVGRPQVARRAIGLLIAEGPGLDRAEIVVADENEVDAPVVERSGVVQGLRLAAGEAGLERTLPQHPRVLVAGVDQVQVHRVAGLGVEVADQDGRKAVARAALLLQTSVHIAFGREVSIPSGLTAGLAWPQSALAATWLEWSMLFTLFPLLILFGERLHRIARVQDIMDAARRHANKHPNAGVLALGLLTLMPGLPVGALTSAFIGESLRLPSWRLLPVLALAELVANVTIAVATAALVGWLPSPRIGAAVIAVAFLGLAIYAWFAPRFRAPIRKV